MSTVDRTIMTPKHPAGYTILTHNVQGLNSPTKRSKAFQHYYKMRADVLLLQETHFSRPRPLDIYIRDTQHFFCLMAPIKNVASRFVSPRRFPFTPSTVIRDKEGRYVMVVGKINDREVTFLSYYAPNVGQLPFFRSMLEVIMPHVAGHVVFGGDSNTSLDRILDKTNPGRAVLKHVPRRSSAMARLLHSYDLIDVWRDFHPTARDFTYYSHVHRTYSRIDHLFTLSPLLPYVSSAKISPMAWSDHSSVQMVLTDLWSKSDPSPWRLNESLLNDPVLEKEVERAIQLYFQENSSPGVSPGTLWAAHKVTIRGVLLQLASRVKRERDQAIRHQEDELDRLMRDQTANPHIDFRNQIDEARTALNLSLTTKAEKSVRWACHRYYTLGDKPNTLLARKCSLTKSKSGQNIDGYHYLP